MSGIEKCGNECSTRMNICKEFILRIITLVLLWLYLVTNISEIIVCVIFTIYYLINSSSVYETIFQISRASYYLLELSIGILILNRGKRGVNDSILDLLEDAFYYICYLMVYRITSLILLATGFLWYRGFTPIYKDTVVLISDKKSALVVGHVLALGFNIFTAIMLKLCIDVIRRNEIERLEESEGNIEITCIHSTVTYTSEKKKSNDCRV